MLDHVLVPLDGSTLAECVLSHAVALAHTFAAKVTLLHVLEQSEESLDRSKVDPLDWYLKKSQANVYLNNVKARLEERRIVTETHVVEGRVVDQIIDLANAHKSAILLLSNYGEHGLKSGCASLTVQQVLPRLRISALIVRAHPEGGPELDSVRYNRVLIPLDGSRRAEAALPIAVRLARSHDAQLSVMHVVTKPEMPRRMPLSEEDAELIHRVTSRNQEEGSKYLQQLLTQLPDEAKTHLMVGDTVTSTIKSFADQEDVDLMVMSAHGYSGEAHLPHGHVTGRFVAEFSAPLLIVQDGVFEPPVTSTERETAEARAAGLTSAQAMR